MIKLPKADFNVYPENSRMDDWAVISRPVGSNVTTEQALKSLENCNREHYRNILKQRSLSPLSKVVEARKYLSI